MLPQHMRYEDSDGDFRFLDILRIKWYNQNSCDQVEKNFDNLLF